MFELSKDQETAFDAYCEWRKSGKKLMTMGGVGGSGKSFLISHIKEKFPMTRIAFCAFTGRAALVLKNKLESRIRLEDYCGTIHGLIYHPVIDKKTKKIKYWKRNPYLSYDLIIVDEASMVDEFIFRDLSSYDIPILAVGDHCQLPPVNGDFNLMQSPDVKLETPHRFAANQSLIKVASIARETGKIPFGELGEGIKKLPYRQFMDSEFEEYVKSQDFSSGDSVIICAYNKTRINLNNQIRSILGLHGGPQSKDRVVCLKNNKKNFPPIFNGLCGNIKKIDFKKHCSDLYDATISLDGCEDEYLGDISKDSFSNQSPDLSKKEIDYFDYGYALTTHKCQGSEFKNVLVIEQECDLWDHKRWIYTAISRSSKNLIILK